MKHEIKLGQRVKDIVSGFEGIATLRVTALNGCIQYGIKPMYLDKDEKVPSVELIDQQQLDIIDEKPITRIRPRKVRFKLGDKLEHTITGFHGTATVLLERISGEIEFGIMSKMKSGDIEMPKATVLSQATLSIRKEKPIEVEKKKTGGTIQDLQGIKF